MKIYGAGSLEDIKKCVKLGVVGILTNPQGFDQYFKGKKTLKEITKEICNITDLPVFIQIHGSCTDEIIERAHFRMRKDFLQLVNYRKKELIV
jgi:predicted TIM-barrel fold metal-dependent hydrolase